MKELLIMAKSLGGGGSEVALIELINALPEELYNITLVLLDSDNEYAYRLKKNVNFVQLTFNSSFAKSLVSMYAFPAKVLINVDFPTFGTPTTMARTGRFLIPRRRSRSIFSLHASRMTF